MCCHPQAVTGEIHTLLICRDAFFSLDYAFALSQVSDASTPSVIFSPVIAFSDIPHDASEAQELDLPVHVVDGIRCLDV